MAEVVRNVVALSRPVEMSGIVVKGFGRGSKMLGIPTANLPQSSLGQLPEDFATGIYFGWATVDGAGPYKMVTSVGWNPYFNNKTKTIEPHLLHEFKEDFYGSEIRIIITGFLRPELNFDGLETLIQAINDDIAVSRTALDNACHVAASKSAYLKARPRSLALGRTAVVMIGAASLAAAIFLYLKRK